MKVGCYYCGHTDGRDDNGTLVASAPGMSGWGPVSKSIKHSFTDLLCELKQPCCPWSRLVWDVLKFFFWWIVGHSRFRGWLLSTYLHSGCKCRASKLYTQIVSPRYPWNGAWVDSHSQKFQLKATMPKKNVCTPALSRYPSVSAFALVFSFFLVLNWFCRKQQRGLKRGYPLQVEDVGSNLAHHPPIFRILFQPIFPTYREKPVV